MNIRYQYSTNAFDSPMRILVWSGISVPMFLINGSSWGMRYIIRKLITLMTTTDTIAG